MGNCAIDRTGLYWWGFTADASLFRNFFEEMRRKNRFRRPSGRSEREMARIERKKAVRQGCADGFSRRPIRPENG